MLNVNQTKEDCEKKMAIAASFLRLGLAACVNSSGSAGVGETLGETSEIE